ncbi:MAG: CPBP family intramembrane metalloprotease [Myxococcota bacterium]|nr:CPBP family intramembrane metalloprotease [Myxococcota bacterium]
MTLLRRIFFSADGRPRSGWVIAVFLLALGLLSAGMAWVLGPGGADSAQLDPRALSRQILVSWTQLAVVLVATGVACWAGRQRLGDAHLQDPSALRRLGAGLLGGALIITAVAVVPWLFGEFAFQLSPEPPGAVATSLGLQGLMLLPAATMEEVLVRGLVLQQLARGLGRVAAVGLTGLLFGAMHLGNPEATAFGFANIVLVGFVFGGLTVRQGSLWAATGLHIAWNVLLGTFWGLPVSGFDFGLSVLEPTYVGHPLWTGGAFGPEASAVTTAVLALTLAVVLRIPVRGPEAAAAH